MGICGAYGEAAKRRVGIWVGMEGLLKDYMAWQWKGRVVKVRGYWVVAGAHGEAARQRVGVWLVG